MTGLRGEVHSSLRLAAFALSAAAGDTAPGTRFSVELWEFAEPGDAAEGVVVSPAAGPAELGFEDLPMRMRVMFVPIDYEGRIPTLDPETLDAYLDNIYEQNPLTELLYEVHEPVVYEQTLVELGDLLPVLAALRADEQAAADVYYHALVDVGAASFEGKVGIADIAGPDIDEAAARVQATVAWAGNPLLAADTITHEIGHSQGLHHVDCDNATAADADLGFPHVDGHIGRDGYGLRRERLYGGEEAYDYMSYCGPTWVSDWTWALTFARIEALTSWGLGTQAGFRVHH